MRFINNLLFKKSKMNVEAVFYKEPQMNPYGYLEHPHEQQFGHTPPERIEPIKRNCETGSDPVKHYAGLNDETPYAIAKPCTTDAANESLAYRLSKHLAPGLVPETYVRHYKDPFVHDDDRLVPHSVQKYVKPHPTDPHPEIGEIAHDPDFHKMALFDYLIGNWDRKPHNILRDENGKLHAIDHAHAFSYWMPSDSKKRDMFPLMDANYTRPHGDKAMIHSNLSAIKRLAGDSPIPEDFRKNVMHGNQEQMHNLIMQAKHYLTGNPHDHESERSRHFNDRFGTLHYHLQDPRIKTMGQLHDALYSHESLGQHHDHFYGPSPFYEGEHEGMWG